MINMQKTFSYYFNSQFFLFVFEMMSINLPVDFPFILGIILDAKLHNMVRANPTLHGKGYLLLI